MKIFIIHIKKTLLAVLFAILMYDKLSECTEYIGFFKQRQQQQQQFNPIWSKLKTTPPIPSTHTFSPPVVFPAAQAVFQNRLVLLS